MLLPVNLRHLERKSVRLQGELSPEEVDLDIADEMVKVAAQLRYDLEVERLQDNLLVQGALRLPLRCQCVRCLKPFTHELDLNNWVCHVPLEGEDAAPVVNDCVDLTPYVREDTLLAFPQHPLCAENCPGLLEKASGSLSASAVPERDEEKPSVWAELNKLKFN
jgi:uncharacterized protein